MQESRLLQQKQPRSVKLEISHNKNVVRVYKQKEEEI